MAIPNTPSLWPIQRNGRVTFIPAEPFSTGRCPSTRRHWTKLYSTGLRPTRQRDSSQIPQSPDSTPLLQVSSLESRQLPAIHQFRLKSLQKRLNFDYETVLSDDEARKEAADLVNKVQKNYQYLQRRCESSGNDIVKRWKKISGEKRTRQLSPV